MNEPVYGKTEKYIFCLFTAFILKILVGLVTPSNFFLQTENLMPINSL